MKGRLPSWFRQKLPDPEVMSSMVRLLDNLSLHTICESALCPNIGQCFAQRTATFLILGDVCSRHCTFCAVKKGQPLPVDDEEPQHLLKAVEMLNLSYVVITSVTRDDLSDGGASHFVKAVDILHERRHGTLVEVVIPDFLGSTEADYNRSLELLSTVKSLSQRVVTKSGLMLGLGETRDEVIEVMKDLRRVNCDLLTIGQYLQPSLKHHPVVRYVPPEEFSEYERIGKGMGFVGIASAPMVRSSFKAAELYAKALFRLSEGVQ